MHCLSNLGFYVVDMVNTLNNDSESPLHFAIRMQHLEMVKLLVENGSFVLSL